MPTITYDGRIFRALDNSENGSVNAVTRFYYHQDGDLVWATYSGGQIRSGHLIAKAAIDGSLDMRYHHLETNGELRTGICATIPELLPDGRLRLHERWQWTSGDASHGTSTLEEIPKDETR